MSLQKIEGAVTNVHETSIKYAEAIKTPAGMTDEELEARTDLAATYRLRAHRGWMISSTTIVQCGYPANERCC